MQLQTNAPTQATYKEYLAANRGESINNLNSTTGTMTAVTTPNLTLTENDNIWNQNHNFIVAGRLDKKDRNAIRKTGFDYMDGATGQARHIDSLRRGLMRRFSRQQNRATDNALRLNSLGQTEGYSTLFNSYLDQLNKHKWSKNVTWTPILVARTSILAAGPAVPRVEQPVQETPPVASVAPVALVALVAPVWENTKWADNAKKYGLNSEDEVKNIQNQMKTAGVYTGKIDGKWGNESMRAYELMKKGGYQRHGTYFETNGYQNKYRNGLWTQGNQSTASVKSGEANTDVQKENLNLRAINANSNTWNKLLRASGWMPDSQYTSGWTNITDNNGEIRYILTKNGSRLFNNGRALVKINDKNIMTDYKYVNNNVLYLDPTDNNWHRLYKNGGIIKFATGGDTSLLTDEQKIANAIYGYVGYAKSQKLDVDFKTALQQVRQLYQSDPSLLEAFADNEQFVNVGKEIVKTTDPQIFEIVEQTGGLKYIIEQMDNTNSQQEQQVTQAKMGTKLDYIKNLKGQCPEGYETVYLKAGGNICQVCQKKKQQLIELAKCSKKVKKLQTGGISNTMSNIKSDMNKNKKSNTKLTRTENPAQRFLRKTKDAVEKTGKFIKEAFIPKSEEDFPSREEYLKYVKKREDAERMALWSNHLWSN